MRQDSRSKDKNCVPGEQLWRYSSTKWPYYILWSGKTLPTNKFHPPRSEHQLWTCSSHN